MSSLQTRHPEDLELLRYLDGELPKSGQKKLQRHLSSCWQCRAELHELENTVGDCVRYRDTVLKREMPPAPGPWADLTREFDRIESEVRVRRSPLGGFFRWPAIAFAAMALIGVLVFELWRTPSVEAAELLKKATVAAKTFPRTPRRLRIRTKTQQWVRTAGGDSVGQPVAIQTENLFRQANYNWNDPLSAQSFESWREGLQRKQDEVTEQSDRYRIRTVSDSGPVANATLTLRRADLMPSELRLEFRNQDWVEVSEAAQEPVPASNAIASNGRPSARPEPIAATADEGPAPDPSAGLSLELQVATALHRAGADLGDPIEVTRDGGQVIVSGKGVPANRQQQLHEVLDPIPNVSVRFSEPSVPARSGAAVLGGDDLSQPGSTLRARIEARVGGRAQFERLSTRVLDLSEAAMSRAYALRRLANEFPVEAEAKLSAEDRSTLRKMALEHVAAFSREAGSLESTLGPLLPGGSAQGGGVPSTWQAAVETVLRSSSRVEKLSAVFLGATPSDLSDAEVASELSAGLSRLQNQLRGVERLLTQ